MSPKPDATDGLYRARVPNDVTVTDIDEAVYAAIKDLPRDHHPAEAVPSIRAALKKLYRR